MKTPAHPTGEGAQPEDPATTIRTTVRQLDAIEPKNAGFLNALAFILMRVADADQHLADEERARMEHILVECAGLTLEQAVLVVEIARHRARLADCGCSYGTTRWLRSELDNNRRQRVLDCLFAVAAADGHTSRSEENEILQIARELGYSADEVKPT
jgi:uncharacterized tellurite resistance protein B-like protein